MMSQLRELITHDNTTHVEEDNLQLAGPRHFGVHGLQNVFDWVGSSMCCSSCWLVLRSVSIS